MPRLIVCRLCGAVLFACLVWAAGGAYAGDAEDDPEIARQQGATVNCCETRAGVEHCERVPVETGCRGAGAHAEKIAPPAEEVAAALQETIAAPSWFLDHRDPPLTPRGELAQALLIGDVTDVFIGTIEGEEAWWGPSPIGPWQLNTWCTIRVHKVYKGTLRAGALAAVMYDGGKIGDFAVFGAHGPRCYPFDFGVFALSGWEGASRPVWSATKSMLADGGSDWRDHRWTRMLDDLAPVLVGDAR